MLSSKLETALTQLEQQSQAVTSALSCDEATALEQASISLREMAVVLTQLVRDTPASERSDPQFVLRVRRQGETMVTQREGLIRRMVAVDRALGVLMPAALQATTYGANANAHASPYGSAGRQTGAFKLLSA